ncbi:uncharacterized protein LOC131614577 [Vicia villosa]|uniref:uncharacterized protein LOC131614577 n=1 Tax=Vicia villosa TaxID=3911 RepID=UPI00273BFED2|nr:uncharacterized protein LOC131614577 [Vicia villosa]
MMDDIVEEVGEENVVQIITDNVVNYKLVGQILMEKRNKLYWTTCAAHCIDLMLEDFKSNIPMHKEIIASGKKITTYIYARMSLITLLHHYTEGGELIRPGITRLGCLNDKRGPLYRMFTSKEWKDSRFAKIKDGKLVENTGDFSSLKVLRMVDSNEKPSMGYIYEAMDQAKEEMQTSYNNKRKVTNLYGKLYITDGTNNYIGLCMLPVINLIQCCITNLYFKADNEVKKRMYACLERMMGGNMDMVNKIDGQLEDFKSKKGFFRSEIAQHGQKNKTPTQWWESYGDAHPELQSFANRMLCLTCSSSGCERNWSAFEMLNIFSVVVFLAVVAHKKNIKEGCQFGCCCLKKEN